MRERNGGAPPDGGFVTLGMTDSTDKSELKIGHMTHGDTTGG